METKNESIFSLFSEKSPLHTLAECTDFVKKDDEEKDLKERLSLFGFKEEKIIFLLNRLSKIHSFNSEDFNIEKKSLL